MDIKTTGALRRNSEVIMRGTVRKRIKLTQQRLRDLLDYNPETGEFIWRPKPAGCVNKKGYAHICVDGIRYPAHRLAWLHVYGEWPPEMIDHANTVRDDNRIANLRKATNGQNKSNCRAYKGSASGTKGVYPSFRGKPWRSQIRKPDGGIAHLGHFDTIEEASAAYFEAAKKYHGEFARQS